MPERVFVAMSGGVDSAVSAHLLKQAGYAVTGIHLELAPTPSPDTEKEHADLENTCRLLEVPLVYLHLEEEFRERIIDYFCGEYGRGRTPNPCVRCNQQVKFGLLLEKVRELGGSRLATGHYARIEAAGSEYRLLKGRDPLKDQSYFLYRLAQRELAQVIFPVGSLFKAEVKRIATGLGLPAAVRRESQDICFISDGDSCAFLSERIPPRPGDIVDTSGRILGRHRGLAFYTIGQRQGVGVSGREPLYVVRLDSANNRLVVGPGSMLLSQKLRAEDLSWISGRPPGQSTSIRAKVRYRSAEVEAMLEMEEHCAINGGAINGGALITFKEAQRAIAPGQSVVVYREDAVLGGGIIAEAF
jgi:tRNA-uridine 2-sulfurtransferase